MFPYNSWVDIQSTGSSSTTITAGDSEQAYVPYTLTITSSDTYSFDGDVCIALTGHDGSTHDMRLTNQAGQYFKAGAKDVITALGNERCDHNIKDHTVGHMSRVHADCA